MNESIIELLEARRLLSSDLVGGLVGRVPADLAFPGQANQLHARLTNDGETIAAGPVTVKLFASTDATLDGGDSLLSSVTRNARLPAGRSLNIPLRFASPTLLAGGDYFLLTQVTAAQSSSVTASASPVAIQSPFSDLSLSFASLPNKPIEIDGVSSGSRGTLVKIFNDGNVQATASVQVNLFMSSDAVLDGSDPLLATVPARKISLKAGKSEAFGLRIAVPPGTVVGGYFLFATLTGSGADINPDNNVAITSQRVAVVDKLPRPRHERLEVIVYYDGPDYVDYPGSYGYFSDTYVPSPDDETPPPVDDGNDGSPPSTDPSTQDGNESDDPTTQPTDSGSAPSDPNTTQPSDPTATQPSSDGNDGGDNSNPPDDGGDNSDDGGDNDGGGDNSGDSGDTGDSGGSDDSGGSADGSDGGSSDSSDGGDDTSDAVMSRKTTDYFENLKSSS
jgi:hypothetical protein